MKFVNRFCMIFSFMVLPILNFAQSVQSGEKIWFSPDQIADSVWRIDDHGVDNVYLVTGDQKALLIDTGYGIADLAGMVQTLTDLPVIVVNTHGHPDHVGGNFQFSQIYVHPLDFNVVRQFTTPEIRDNNVRQMMQQAPDLETLFLKEADMTDPPELIPVKAGFVFDLGNRKLEVIEMPGHTPGSIALLDEKHKLLFTGDSNNTLVWLFLQGCLPLETYQKSLKILNSRNDAFDYLLPGHGDMIDKYFIEEQIVCVQQILDGTCQGEPYESFAGPALCCSYKRASVAYDSGNLFID